MIWRLMAYCHPRAILLRARHIQGCLNVIADSLSRRDKVIQTEWSLHPKIFQRNCQIWHRPMIDLFATKMNNKLPLYVSPVPDPNAMAVDALNISWEVMDGYVYCPIALIPKVLQKMRTYACQMIVVAPGWPGMSWFWDLIDLSTKPPLFLPHWEYLLKQPFSQRFHQNLPYLNLHVWHLDSRPSHLKNSQAQWQRELRHLRDYHPEGFMNQGGPFLNHGVEKQVEFKQPSISIIADFLTHLFNEKNLKPTTIAGYRTAIADHLGPAGIEISHSFELNRLIASFHRDRPVKDRGVPSWDLSLVLLALTKPPFEPLKDAPLKLLTFKTVFLMTLASGRRRGEVHAWTFKSLKHKTGWKEVTVAPSSVFLSKNQLASDGPNVVQPVVIPALKPILDSSLSQDRSLCPVRSLRYYVDKTKDLREGKHLLFISFKSGFSGDIQRATISSWIKQTVILAYQESDLETQKLSRVKAHDVRSMAASLAFKGGVSLDHILGACFWKSHTTFTNFYLKDVSWKSKEGSEYSLGSVVSAQHIVKL